MRILEDNAGKLTDSELIKSITELHGERQKHENDSQEYKRMSALMTLAQIELDTRRESRKRPFPGFLTSAKGYIHPIP